MAIIVISLGVCEHRTIGSIVAETTAEITVETYYRKYFY